jgi:antitoxin (DNA-binding transcriptional repressor) of toxin-antitoxin stability system
MPTKSVEVSEAATQLPDLLCLVAEGTEIILTRNSTPFARIIYVESSLQARTAGLHPGAIRTTDDFDQPLPDEFWLGAE